MDTIIITISEKGASNEVSREYVLNPDISAESWGTRVLDMVETLEKADQPM